MTKLILENSQHGHRIIAKGHATGSQEACNGISAILYALGGWLANCGGDDCTIKLDEGDAELACARHGTDVTAAFAVAVIGLLQIAKKYPEAVAVL